LAGGGRLLRDLGLALPFELLLHRHVGQTLLLDLGEFDHFRFCGGLEALELYAGLRRGVSLTLEVGALCSDLLHHHVEVVELDRCCATGDRGLTIGGDAGVGLVEVDQEGHRGARVDETALGILLQARAHRVGLGLDRRQVPFGGDDLDLEGVEPGFRIEHRLRRGAGAIACRLDLLSSTHRSRILGARHGEGQRGGTDGDGHDHGGGRERAAHTRRRQPGSSRHERRA
jgi:hypothetical protein